MVHPLCFGRSGLVVAAACLAGLWARAEASSPREALTPRVGRQLPRAIPYRLVSPGFPAGAERPGERTLLVLDQVSPRRYGQPLEKLCRELDTTLSSVSRKDIAGVVLGEGNVPWGGGLKVLNALYDHLKKKWEVAVFQSYASPLTPHPDQQADGWVVCPRGLSGEALRRYLIKFLVTGKPVLRLEGGSGAVEAAPLMSLCQRLAVPASFLCAAGCFPPPRSAGTPSAGRAYDLSEVWQQMPEAADTLVAGPVEVGGDRVKRFDYTDHFRQQWFLDDATIVGVSRLRWLGREGLEIVGTNPRREVSLTYDFLGPWETRELVAELAGKISGKAGDFVELALSRDGKQFIHAARAYATPEGNPFHLTSVSSYRFDRERFWVRVTAVLSRGSAARLELVRANCRVKPPGLHVVSLGPGQDGRLVFAEGFRSRRILHTAEIDNPRALEWERGGLFVRGQNGQPVAVHIRQRFETAEPVARVVVRLHNAAIGPVGQVENSFAISTDGSTPITMASVRPRDGGWFGTTELEAGPSALPAPSKTFYLHITLKSRGVQSVFPSNILGRIEVEAIPASASTRLAAAK